MQTACIFILTLIGLVACDPVWVKERSITIRSATSSCVGDALKQVPGLTAEKYSDDPVLFYLKRSDSSQRIASIGALVSDDSQFLFLVPPNIVPGQLQPELNQVATALERACGA